MQYDNIFFSFFQNKINEYLEFERGLNAREFHVVGTAESGNNRVVLTTLSLPNKLPFHRCHEVVTAFKPKVYNYGMRIFAVASSWLQTNPSANSY